jgi:hypothetical protein
MASTIDAVWAPVIEMSMLVRKQQDAQIRVELGGTSPVTRTAYQGFESWAGAGRPLSIRNDRSMKSLRLAVGPCRRDA